VEECRREEGWERTGGGNQARHAVRINPYVDGISFHDATRTDLLRAQVVRALSLMPCRLEPAPVGEKKEGEGGERGLCRAFVGGRTSSSSLQLTPCLGDLLATDKGRREREKKKGC